MINQGPTFIRTELRDLAGYAADVERYADRLSPKHATRALIDTAHLLARIAEAVGTIDKMRRDAWVHCGHLTRYDALTDALAELAEAALTVPEGGWPSQIIREAELDALDEDDDL